VLLSLVLALSVRAAFAAPATLTAQLRAVRCCAEHCKRPGALAPRQCCRVASQAVDPTLKSAPAGQGRGPDLDLVTTAASPSSPAAGPVVVTAAGRTSDRAGPPLFLLLRDLRL
jgi:hypothetical protein